MNSVMTHTYTHARTQFSTANRAIKCFPKISKEIFIDNQGSILSGPPSPRNSAQKAWKQYTNNTYYNVCLLSFVYVLILSTLSEWVRFNTLDTANGLSIRQLLHKQ